MIYVQNKTKKVEKPVVTGFATATEPTVAGHAIFRQDRLRLPEIGKKMNRLRSWLPIFGANNRTEPDFKTLRGRH